MTKSWITYFAPGFVALAVIASACNGDRDGFGDGNPGFASDASPEARCATPGKTCSLDLHSVVDGCDPSTVYTVCPPDQGCANGACVPACDASVSSSSSVGCEFVAIRPAYSNVAAEPQNVLEDACFAAFVVNTWGSPLDVTAEHAGAPIDVTRSGRIIRSSGGTVTYDPFTGTLAPNEAAVLFLEHKPGAQIPCPAGIDPAVLDNSSLAGTARGTASTYWIKTSAPVGAYSIYPFGGAKSFVASATLLLPVPAWKADYVLSDSWSGVVLDTVAANPTIQVVAQEDNTVVTLVGGVAVQPGVSVAGAASGVPQTYQLQRGELLQFSQKEELAGSFLSANKNVAVWGGHECMWTGDCCCDQSTRQLLPLQSWGDEYVAVPYTSRRADKLPENYNYRVGAAADGTILTYEPAPPQDAPLTLAKGASVQFTTTTPFTVRSQDANHAIALYEYMTGEADAPNAEGGDGDPEFSFVVPAKQYLNNYIFFVDPSYRNSQLVVVRARPDGGGDFQDVTLDCAGPLTEWTSVGSSGRYEYTQLALMRGFIDQEIGTGTCGAGPHSMTSSAPFGVTVWGTDAYSSYAYPGGAGIRTLNNVTATVH